MSFRKSSGGPLPLLLAISLVTFILILSAPGPAAAFGAGNIGSISGLEGKAFRHGDIEDCIKSLVITKAAISLLSKKFGAMDVKRIYFGNWLRDYSQAIDVGTLGRNIPLATLAMLVAVLGFSAHGYATEEFEVTEQRLGCYRPEEHIDNPKGYADGEDARRYHPGLRGPVDPRELDIDPQTGLKNYIANERGGWATSSAYVRRSLQESIEAYRAGNHCEAMRLLGQALHTLEDFPAHSNFVELTLIELGHERTFPFVGEQTAFRHVTDPNTGLSRRIYPVVTGTFGASDFIHSLLGEASDHVSSASVTGLDKGFDEAKRSAGSASLVELLAQVPGMGDVAREVEDVDRAPVDSLDPIQMKDRIWSLLVLRDKIVKAIELTVEKIPGLTWLSEKVSETLQLFLLTRLEPYVKPLMSQVVSKLEAGSAVLVSSDQQQEVFDNPRCSDPTHSVLSKDHFALYLNEPAGNVATEIVKEVVTAVAQAWSSNDAQSMQHVLNTAMEVFFHPADLETRKTPFQQRLMDVVRTWANENPSLMQRLDKESVQAGRNRRGEAGGHPDASSYSSGFGTQCIAGAYVPKPSVHNTHLQGQSSEGDRYEKDERNEKPSYYPGSGGDDKLQQLAVKSARAHQQQNEQDYHGTYEQNYVGYNQYLDKTYQISHQQRPTSDGSPYPANVLGTGDFPQPELPQPDYGRHGAPQLQYRYEVPGTDSYSQLELRQPGFNDEGQYPSQQTYKGSAQVYGFEQQPTFPNPDIQVIGQHKHRDSEKHRHKHEGRY